MNKTTSRILIYAVIFLAVLNVTTFITIGYHIYHPGTMIEQQMTGSSINRNYNGRYFRDRLQLDKDQMNEFRSINDNFRTKARTINLNLQHCRQEMMNEMQNDNVDTSKLNALSDSIGQLHKSLKIDTYKYYIAIKKICNQKQSNELNSMFDEFFIGNGMHHGQHEIHRRGKDGENVMQKGTRNLQLEKN